ncbi:MAG: T9SS type A sorting domain-containing protein [Bacteroidota bacterium]
MKRFLLFFFITGCIQAQTVTTFLDDPSADVDDDMEFDASGNLYGSNFAGDTVYKIDTDGNASVFVDGIANPNGIAIDSSGNVFVVEYSAGMIHKYNSSGGLLESYAVGSFPSGLEKSPSSDDLYFTLVSNNSVNILSPDGTITQLFQGAPLDVPVGLAFDDEENLYVGNYIGGQIHRVSLNNAVYLATVPTDGGGGSPFLAFIGYANSKLYGTIYGAHKIYEIGITTNDDVTLFAGSSQGSDDGPIANATFDNPGGIAFNPTENALYISEFSGDGNIRKIEDMPLSVAEQSVAVKIDLSPNPAEEFVTIKVDPSLGLEIERVALYDSTGSILKTVYRMAQGPRFQLWVDVREIPAGFYLLEVLNSNSETVSVSFIKK